MPDEEGHPELDEMELAAVLTALADPLRRQVITTLIREPDGTERTCISFELGVSKSTLTHHFRVLRESGLVRQVNRGNSRKVSLRRAELEQRFPGLLDLLAAEDDATSKPSEQSASFG
ncbi:helix-turn-helix domain-containing protein [Cutibacterium avidum]|uniref:ArsR/SmtB family transcription factor n=1 Tax=Cutibacterium avidum TaxID=33010 RepID=UPI000A63787F|nr:helix-turn-helix domain-containing protein [Cutibacterium avidum]MCO6631441.1 helix-turn-helix domain-containing protein [Cutibacterium avidum]MCO6660026.1 helix-turn-helix domain-containing protein [Cutibacterium avidum]MCO6664692.1 helix-turn-helix domain-containing protein [Cutibacterium avidum]MCT1416326.1 helix-turn-helix domain-containing protein [Cutibacterium avidum]MCX8466518.1 helix-turn-helix domain-containing protein [Cutibacterium avidum]